MKRQSLLKGTIILGVAGIFAKFLGVFFRWPIIMKIGDEGIGYYQMSYPIYTFFVSIASGVPMAISKLVSEKNASGDRSGIIDVLKSAALFMFIIGGGFSAVLLIFGRQLVAFFQWDSKAYYSLLGISLAPIIISIMYCFRGFFQGMQNMIPTAVSQIIEQIGRVVVGVGLAYLLFPMGIEYSAGGAAFGAAAGGLLGTIYLACKYVRTKNEFVFRKRGKDYAVLTKLIRLAVPMSLGGMLSSVMSIIDSLLVPRKLVEAGFSMEQATALFGQMTGKAFVLVSVPLTLSMALCNSVVPAISESHFLGRSSEVQNRVDTSLRISTVIAFPSTLGLCFMAGPVLRLIFPGHAEGYSILQALSLSLPFMVITQLTTYILQSSKEEIKPVINLGVACVIKVIINYVLVPVESINIYGAVISNLAAYMTATILNIRLLKKNFNYRIKYYEIMIKPAFASILMIIAVVFIYMNVYNYTVRNSISCLLSIFAGVVLYGFLILIFGTFKYSYVKKRFLKK